MSIDSQLLTVVNEAFRRLYDENVSINVQDRVRTRKIPSEKFDRALMTHIQIILANHVKNSPPHNISDISLLLYVVQRTYEVLKNKTIQKSMWKDNIMAKISSLEKAKAVLDKHVSNVSNGVPKQDAQTLEKVFNKYNVKKWDLNDSKRAREELSD